jgi:hypothetical protein
MRRHLSETVVTEFLRHALAVDALGVPELEARARATGLLSERQHITDAKAFKRAKKSLGIKSVRAGFGPRSQWLWELLQPNEPCLRTEQPEAAAVRRVPTDWLEGIACLDPDRPPNDVPRHRWRRFVDDCRSLGRACRATKLGCDGFVRLCAQAAARLFR